MLGKSSKPVIEILTGSIVSGSPRTPADSKIQSPRGLKSLDLGGVGLGIVAALEKSGGGDGVTALFSRNFTRSSPIPVNSPENCQRREAEEIEMEVYSDSPFRIQNRKKSNRGIVFHISPASHAEATGVPAPDFLSSCDLCNKKLHGKDIYMYRGEKAFCSTECRYRQMVMDERKEKCGAEASAAAEVAGSPYNNGKMFAAGILAI